MSAVTTAQKALAGTLGADIGGDALIRQLFDIPLPPVLLAADGAVGTAIASTKIWTNVFDFPVQLVAVAVNPGSAVTADAANNATLTVSVDDGANGAPASAATLVTDLAGGNWAANTSKAFTMVAGGGYIAPGANIFHVQTKAASGVQLPIRQYVMRVRRV